MKILFVCTGNICRSPTAEGVARALFAHAGLDIECDSAGTHDYHAGEAPDPRSQRAALARGYDLSRLRARKIEPGDFQRFDLVLAMDRDHLRLLQRVCPAALHDKIRMFLEYAPELGRDEVPDPYYGGEAGFEIVLDLCEAGARGLVGALRAKA